MKKKGEKHGGSDSFFLGFVLFLSVQGNSRDLHRVTLSLCFLLFSTKMGKSKQKSQRPFHRRFFVRFFFSAVPSAASFIIIINPVPAAVYLLAPLLSSTQRTT